MRRKRLEIEEQVWLFEMEELETPDMEIPSETENAIVEALAMLLVSAMESQAGLTIRGARNELEDKS